MKNFSIMTDRNVLSYGVRSDRITNVFFDCSSYLSVSCFCCFLYTCYRVSLRAGSYSFLVKNIELVFFIIFGFIFIFCYSDFVINFFLIDVEFWMLIMFVIFI